MYFYDFGDLQIVGSSPEILVRQEKREGRKIEIGSACDWKHLLPMECNEPQGKNLE